MGYLLKQGLKSICGANHWSYAVFWKAGVQNPKLLIWEDCYLSCSDRTENGNRQLTLEELDRCWLTPASGGWFGVHPQDKVQLLVHKMMMANQVHVVGEGLVGRTAFSGYHQWIVSGNYNGNCYPPEVINELNVQFSAGMQTVALIPVAPLGVVQLGSPLSIMENIGFIQNVKDLILQLDQVPPTTLLPSISDTGEYSRYIGPPEMASGFPHTTTLRDTRVPDSGASFASCTKSSHPLPCEARSNLQVKYFPSHKVSTLNVSRSQAHSSDQATAGSYMPPTRHLGSKHARAEVITVRSDMARNQQSSLITSGSGCTSYGQAADSNYLQNARVLDPLVDQTSSSCTSVMTSHLDTSGIQYSDLSASWKASAGTKLRSGNSYNNVVEDIPPCVMQQQQPQPIAGVVSGPLSSGKLWEPVKEEEERCLFYTGNMASTAWPSCEPIPELNKFPGTKQYTKCTDNDDDDNLVNQSSSGAGGDDLFDIVGMEFKNRIIPGYDHACSDFDGNVVEESPMEELKKDKFEDLTSFLINPKDDWFSESGIFSSSSSDHLLEAVVSGIHHDSTQSAGRNLSCLTTLTRDNSSSVPTSSPKLDMYEMSEHYYTESAPRPVEVGPGFGNERAASTIPPQMSSSHGSSWAKQVKHESSSSVATANSRKSAGAFGGKPNRKRVKPGESPRPRPKDRQMIQDRVKELREIIPNAGKCSIDALLERTIKHMLFLQSVTKHADKLKQVSDCKSIDEEEGGGLLVRDKFERGATWAYEVGSQAMVCPIVVEDLNPPRQLLVKMLCEEKGLFLEIADMIRGMGLTILKGVMESRNNKVWARFAVESDRDVTRMEVFISLVHLLEQAGAGKGNTAAAPMEDDDRSIRDTVVGFDQLAAGVANKKQRQLVSANEESQVMC